jgi:hypothetical protein
MLLTMGNSSGVSGTWWLKRRKSSATAPGGVPENISIEAPLFKNS